MTLFSSLFAQSFVRNDDVFISSTLLEQEKNSRKIKSKKNRFLSFVSLQNEIVSTF